MPDFKNILGGLLYQLYNLVGHDYGLALLLFTVIVKLILTPLNIKQIKSTMKTQQLQPEMKKLQERYKNDKEKLNQEMVNFFKENNHNPASGCLPTLIQLPILFILWRVISEPITTMLGGGQYVSSLLSATKGTTETDVIFGFSKEIGNKLMEQNLVPQVIIDKILDLQTGMHFLGIFNLAKIPVDPLFHWPQFYAQVSVYLPLLLIPILATIFTYISSKMMMANVPVTNNVDTSSPFGDPMKMQKSMLYMGPAMTLIFSFQLPAGLGLYWLAGYFYQIFQQIYINKTIYAKKDIEVKELIVLNDNKDNNVKDNNDKENNIKNDKDNFNSNHNKNNKSNKGNKNNKNSKQKMKDKKGVAEG